MIQTCPDIFQNSSILITAIHGLPYNTTYSHCLPFQINTNGFVAFSEPPPEEEYLGKMPGGFKMIAALLGDLDNSDGQGNVYFRQDNSPEVLSRAGELIKRAFPGDSGIAPVLAVIVTWENMAAKGSSGRGDGLDAKVDVWSVFQIVVKVNGSPRI